MNASRAKAQTYIKGLIDLAIKLVMNPADFFRTMPKTGGVIDPLLYVVMAALLSVVISAVESSILYGAGVHDLAMLLIWLIIVPLIAAIMSFFVAAVCFAIWSFTGSSENYEASYRCLAYMHILMPITILLSFVPYLGLLGIAWWFYLMLVATREAHKISIKPALPVFGIIAALSGLIYYNSVSSEMQSRERLKEFTKELQKMPGKNDMGSPASR